MIYLVNQPGPQAVMIPKPVTGTGPLTMTFRSTVNQTEPVDAGVIDISVSQLYYFLAVTVPEGMQPGEYEYDLRADGIPVASGVAMIRDTYPTVQYIKQATYEQYETI